MPTRPLLVYLDSNDYSSLSDPRQQNDALRSIRSALLKFAAEGSVEYVFSGANLSEMAPVGGRHPMAASLRADLLVELCGPSALISFDKVIKAELAKAIERDTEPTDPISRSADWFPDLEDFMSPIEWADLSRKIDREVRERGLNREQRRKIGRQLFKSGRPTATMQNWLQGQSGASDYSEILRLYPMRPADAKVLKQYVLGTASKDEAERAFLESLRDPRWMMRWFAAHSDRLTPVTEWFREPARNMLKSMREMADGAKELRELEVTLGSSYRSNLLTHQGWNLAQDRLLCSIANRLLGQFCGTALPLDVNDIDVFCPGLSTMVRSLHSSLWDAVATTPRNPLESDFVDAVHAIYAPYVDVFRADRYMAPHIRRHATRHKTLVVSRLAELPSAIGALLSASYGSHTHSQP
jgi:hypothetical protein